MGEILHSMRATNTVLCVFHLLDILQGDRLFFVLALSVRVREEGGRGQRDTWHSSGSPLHLLVLA